MQMNIELGSWMHVEKLETNQNNAITPATAALKTPAPLFDIETPQLFMQVYLGHEDAVESWLRLHFTTCHSAIADVL